jgi:superfamily I DNA/RNA helicase
VPRGRSRDVIEITHPLLSYKEFPGPVLLLAGPGTGKTYQLAMRVKYLVEDRSATPEEMTVITFTNEAARNMRERLSEEDIDIPSDRKPAIISTMHSLGNTIIGSHPSAVELPEQYSVLHEEQPREVLLQDATRIARCDFSLWSAVDECRRKGACRQNPSDDKCRICREYTILLRKCRRVDHDDQILLACQALREDRDLASSWRAKTRYLLVDEYQDINEAQRQLIELLTKGQAEGLFAVGDDDQSIYSFRGGNPRYIREFGSFFGDNARIGRLSKSWRCPEHILKGARAVVAEYYEGSTPKPEPTFSEEIEENKKIVFLDVPSDRKEARIIAAIAEHTVQSASVAIIIPNRQYFPPIKEALRQRGLDYMYKSVLDPKGLVRFTVLADWAEARDDNLNLRYLTHLIVNHHDNLTGKVAVRDNRITSKRQAASEVLARLWSGVHENTSLYEVLCEKAQREEEGSFLHTLKSCLDDAICLLTEKGGTRGALAPFLEKCGQFVAPGGNPKGIIAEIQEWRNEKLTGARTSSYPPVSIYNMPSSKGLEADVVIVIGLSEELFPSEEADLEESSRLLYVAMTRAKKELYLFSARRRPATITFHPASYQFKRSRFVDAIPSQHMNAKWIKADSR